MDKIYSRKRLIIPKIKLGKRGSSILKTTPLKKKLNQQSNDNLDKKINKKLVKTAIIVILGVCIANRIISIIEPTVDLLCIEKAKSASTIVANEEAKGVMQNYKYEDISNVIRDDQGNIEMIQLNIVNVNKITSDVAVEIQKRLDNYKNEDFSLKLGTFTGLKTLSGRGPDIPILISTVGNVRTDLTSEFSQAGINQTLHRIYLNVECSVTILSPFNNLEETISNKVLLAEAVIVGDVPETYYNFEGVESKNAIEVIN